MTDEDHRSWGHVPPGWTALLAGRFGDTPERAAHARVDASRAGDAFAESDAVELLGLVASARGDREEAVARYRSVVERRRAIGTDDLDAFELARHGGICHDLGLLEEAIEHLEEAMLRASRARSVDAERESAALLGAAQSEHGDYDAALETLLLARDLAVATNAVDVRALVAIERGWLVELRGRPAEEAVHHFEEGLDLARQAGRAAPIALAAASLANAMMAASDAARPPTDAVRALLAEAHHHALAEAIPNVAPAVAVRTWTCQLRAGEIGAGEVSARLAAMVRGVVPQSEARIAIRGLEALLGSEGAAVEVASDGSWFSLGGRTIDLGRRPSLMRVLARLAAGTVVPWAELLAAGWPAERVRPEAGFGRVRSAVWTLRKLGLEGHLAHDPDGGYRLVGACVRPVATESA